MIHEVMGLAIFKEAILLSKEDFLTNVTVFREPNDTVLTVTPKSNQSLILFSPLGNLMIQILSRHLIQTFEVSFQDVKQLGGRPYYTFEIIRELDQSLNKKSLYRAYFRDSEGVGIASIIEYNIDSLVIETNDSLTGRNVEVHFKHESRIHLFDGKISWLKTKQNRHYYGLYLK